MVHHVLTFDVPNKNNRIYPSSLKEQILNDASEECPIFGKIGMPYDYGEKIKFSDCSHLVTSLFVEGNDLMAEITLLNTEKGNDLIKLLEDGKVCFRTAGFGDVHKDENGVNIVENYYLTSINAVLKEEAS